MRLWSLHPSYLDRQGLVALWRESLLAQKVLAGGTRGYRHHPQLTRFRAAPDPMRAIGAYLSVVAEEACRRGYSFDASKILEPAGKASLAVTRGQLRYEAGHLLRKLRRRDPALFRDLEGRRAFRPHPLFRVVPGAIESWEKP
jgi:hypothetical protein